MAHLPKPYIILEKPLSFMCLLVLFIVQNFKKSLEWIWSFEDTLQGFTYCMGGWGGGGMEDRVLIPPNPEKLFPSRLPPPNF